MSIAWSRRVLTGLVGIPTALSLLSSNVGMLLLTTTLCCLSLVEFIVNICPRIAPQHGTAKVKITHGVLLVATGVVLCSGAWSGVKLIYDALTFGATMAIFTFHITTSTKMDQTAVTRLLLDIFALIYIVSGFSHAILLRFSSNKYGHGLQVLGLCCAWVCDSGALVIGYFMGHTKLASAVSPGKTLVGAVAGILSSVITVLFMFAFSRFSIGLPWTYKLLPPLDVVPYSHQLVLGTGLGILCIVGDLVESYVKRVAGIKDSGTFFPGHGGCLDRMDSFLFVAPFLYFYSQFAL